LKTTRVSTAAGRCGGFERQRPLRRFGVEALAEEKVGPHARH